MQFVRLEYSTFVGRYTDNVKRGNREKRGHLNFDSVSMATFIQQGLQSPTPYLVVLEHWQFVFGFVPAVNVP